MLHKWGSRQLMTDASLSAERAHGCQGKMKEVGISCLDFFFLPGPQYPSTPHTAPSLLQGGLHQGLSFVFGDRPP